MLLSVRIPYALALIAITLCIAGFVPNEEVRLVEKANAIRSSCEEEIDPVSCYALALEQIASKEGVGKSITMLHTLRQSDPRADRNCHSLTHGIGYGAYRRAGGNIELLLKTIPSECSNGALHSILERAWVTEGFRQDIRDIERTCANSERSDCTHFIGHYSYITAQGDVTKTLETCRLLEKKSSRLNCYTGAFMEYLVPAGGRLPDTGTEITKFRESVEMLRNTCATLTEDAAIGCWTTISYGMIAYATLPEIGMECEKSKSSEATMHCKEYAAFMYAIRYPGDLWSIAETCIQALGIPKDRCVHITSYTKTSYAPWQAGELAQACTESDNPNNCLSGIGAAAKAADLFTRHRIEQACLKKAGSSGNLCRASAPQSGNTWKMDLISSF